MARPDMSPKAVTVRLIRTSQLRKLCTQLGRRPDGATPKPPPSDEPGGASN